jgi:hypothetical protein
MESKGAEINGPKQLLTVEIEGIAENANLI